MNLTFCQRHPEMCRFALPNAVWNWELKPGELTVLAYLYYCREQPSDEKEIAVGIHMSVSTVRKRLSSLAAKGLITTEATLVTQPVAKAISNCFTLPNEVFLLRLPPSALAVYAYLLYCEDRRSYRCHPSCRTIAAATRMAVNTVVKSVSILAERQLIMVEQTRYLDGHGMKWVGNNCYTILPIAAAVEQFHQRQLRQLEMDTAKYNAARKRTA